MSKRPEYDGERDMERFWREAVPEREPARQRYYLPVVLGATVLSVPFYRSAGPTSGMLFGLPDWVVMTLLCSVVISAVTSFAAFRNWRDGD